MSVLRTIEDFQKEKLLSDLKENYFLSSISQIIFLRKSFSRRKSDHPHLLILELINYYFYHFPDQLFKL